MGNVRSIGALMRGCGERAFRFAFGLTGNVEDSKDLVQEAFRRVMLSWDRLDLRKSPEDWLFSILRNLFVDAARRFERRVIVSLDAPSDPNNEDSQSCGEQLAAIEEGLLERLEREESDGWVREALADLDPDFRAVLLLCDVQGLRYGEISRIVGCPVGTVRSRLSRARRAVRKSMRRRMSSLPSTTPSPIVERRTVPSIECWTASDDRVLPAKGEGGEPT